MKTTSSAITRAQIAARLSLCLRGKALVADSTANLADLGLDSMDTVELLCLLHEEFGVRLTEPDFHPDQTVSGLIAAIASKISNHNSI